MTGVFRSWEECKVQIDGYAGAQYRGYPTLEEANEAFKKSYWKDIVAKKQAEAEAVAELPQRALIVSAHVDGDGIMYYEGIDNDQKNTIFRSPIFQDANQNVGDFLGLVHALALMKQTNDARPIVTSSRTALSWITHKNPKTSLARTVNNTKVFDLLYRATTWLNNNSFPNEIIIH